MEIFDEIATVLSEIIVWSSHQSNQVPCLLQNFPFIPKHIFCLCLFSEPISSPEFCSSELSLISVNIKVQQGYGTSFVDNLGTVQMTAAACCGVYFRRVR